MSINSVTRFPHTRKQHQKIDVVTGRGWLITDLVSPQSVPELRKWHIKVLREIDGTRRNMFQPGQMVVSNRSPAEVCEPYGMER